MWCLIIIMPKGRIHKKIQFYEDNKGCWINTSHARNQTGYPRITWKGKYIPMSRYIWEKNYGKIPEGLVVMHKCDNPPCINPLHFKLGTSKDNTQDAVKKNRMCHGEKHKHHKLTEKEVLAILKSNEGPRALGRKYGVEHTTIMKIKKRKTWKHLKINGLYNKISTG